MIKPFRKKLLAVIFLLTAGFYFLRSDISAAEAATLSLTALEKNPAVNEVFEVTILLDTAGTKTPGADVILLFDKEKLEGQEIINGEIFPQYIYKKIDNEKGEVIISGIISFDKPPFSGSGTFAQVKFKAKKAEETKIDFDFTPQDQNDSNVAEFSSGQDILAGAQGINIKIAKSQKGLDIHKLIVLPFNWLKNWLSKIWILKIPER